MNSISKIRYAFYVLSLPTALLLSGCAITDFIFGQSGGNAPPPPPVGFYWSQNQGQVWATRNNILSVNTTRPNLNNVNVVSLVMDPTDRQTFYLGSQSQGLFYTYDSGQSWWPSGPIRSGTINAIALTNDPAKRCTVYIATANRILKTTDCGRFWDQQYYDTRLKERVLSLSVNLNDTNILYAGLSTGDILRSKDAGKSWETAARLPAAVTKFLPHTLNSDIIYAVVSRKGLWKTTDGGTSWQDLSAGLKKFSGATTVTNAIVDPTRSETVIMSSQYGLVRTTDGGESWSALPLLTPAGKATISGLAMNPVNPLELYYTTDTTLYRSKDAGETWETFTLPVSGAKTTMIVDPKIPATLYMGVNRPVK